MKKQKNYPGFFLPVLASQRLKDAVREGGDSLDKTIKQLRSEYPEAFHTDNTLIDRRFKLPPTGEETPHSMGSSQYRHGERGS